MRSRKMGSYLLLVTESQGLLGHHLDMLGIVGDPTVRPCFTLTAAHSLYGDLVHLTTGLEGKH